MDLGLKYTGGSLNLNSRELPLVPCRFWGIRLVPSRGLNIQTS